MTRREMELEGYTMEEMIAEAEEEAAYRAEQKARKSPFELTEEEIEGIREDVYDELGLEYAPAKRTVEDDFDEDDDYDYVLYDGDHAMYFKRGGDRNDVA